MDLSAEEQGRTSQDRAGSGQADSGAGRQDNVVNGENGAAKDEHQFQKAISAWRAIDLGNLVPQLDSTASEVVTNQQDSLVQRKELAQKTKDFRKLEDAAKLAEVKGLLKAYQGFIDLLTNHGKTTSSAFLQLYSSISEAPDPYPLLEASVDSLLVSEDTVPKITAENERLQRSIRNMTRELENAEQQVQQERTLRKQLEEGRDSKAKGIEASWKAVLDEKKDNWEAKERSMEEKLENQDRLLKEIKASYEVSQRLGQPEGTNAIAATSASAAELEIVSSDLERTSQRLAEMEARNEQLRTELAEASSNVPQRQNVEDDPAFARLRFENSSLLRKADAAKLERDSEVRKLESRLRSLEREIQTLQKDREELRDRLYQWRDYLNIKRELDVFKAIELLAEDDDDDAPSANNTLQANGFGGSNNKDSLEQLLLARNKKLSNDMAELRVAHQQLQRDLEQLRETLSTTNAELERSQNLNATLENDLTTLQQEASNAFPMSARSTTSRYPSGAFPSGAYSSRTRKGSPTSSIISGFDSQRSPFDSMEAARSGEPVGGGSGILPMVQAQRDRFKQKNSQLENELSKQYNIVSSLRQEVASLQKDNLNLYEKTRYVSTYQRNSQASSASAYSQAPSSTAIHITQDGGSGQSTEHYRSVYEANISPFAAFRGREATRAYKRMSVPERMIFSVTRLVLASRTSRNVFATYCVALHVLVFLMLYWMQGVDGVKHAGRLSGAALAPRAAGTGPVGHVEGWHQGDLDGRRPG